MADEIRPTRIYVPGKVRPLSRDGREENDERFREKLAELAEEGDQRREQRPHAPQAQPERPDDGAREQGADEGDRAVGRHLDLRT